MADLLKIAIVDDMKVDRENLARKIVSYMQDEDLKYTLQEYESGEAFLDALMKEHFDIIFMDIFMQGMSGLDAAAQLRKEDLDSKLIFLTTSPNYYRNGYTFNSAYYILKDQDGESIPHHEFLQAMKNCRIQRQFDIPFLDIVSIRETIRIHTEDIVYVDFVEKSTNIHLENRHYTVWDSFKKTIEPLMADRRFILCFRGILVNMDFVEELEEKNFLLKNGMRLPISYRDRKQLQKTYMLYTMDKAEARLCKQ